jgi:hypothetical protein
VAGAGTTDAERFPVRHDGVISRRTFLAGTAAAAGGLAVTGPTLWLPPARAAAPPVAGVHLGFGTDPSRAMAVSWSTAAGVAAPVVEIGVDGTFGRTVAPETRSAPGVGTVYHHAVVGGLDPGETYTYRIRHDGGDPVAGTFTTAPANPNVGFRFATFGDMGVSEGAKANLEHIRRAQPAFCFVVGDLCYADLSGGTSALSVLPHDPGIWDRWFTQIQPSAASVPWMSTVGNHEMERDAGDLGYRGYLARFALPANGVVPSGFTAADRVTYWFRYGNVAFVALDGNDASYEIDRNHDYLGRDQDAWLDATLAALRADTGVDFIVVGFHNCMYCSNLFHGSDGGNRRRWESILERHGVDLVVNGHNHSYERTHPLRGGAPVAEAGNGSTVDSSKGTTYLTAGGAGQAEYPTSAHPVSYVVAERVPGLYGGVRVPELATWSSVRHLAHSVAVVDVTPRDRDGVATMTLTGLAKVGGTVIDRVTLRRQAA